MELKVWVDGMKRVVCGVTDRTTCQDIVIALAQAMGRTGRFTLVEKWRENERPLSPSECPMQVLHKWGEFANEVQLCLIQSDVKKIKPEKDAPSRTQDRFTHNFTPPPKTIETNVKRSLTFSGAHKTNTPNLKRNNFIQGPNSRVANVRSLSRQEHLSPSGDSWSSSSSLSSQSSVLPPSQKSSTSSHGHVSSKDQSRQSQQSYLPLSGSTHLSINGSQRTRERTSPSISHNQTSVHNQNRHNNSDGKSLLSVIQNRTSAFHVVKPRSETHSQNATRLVNSDIGVPVYIDHNMVNSSQRPEAEEYDLDSNFPDVVKDSNRDTLIEEYHVPGRTGNHDNRQPMDDRKTKEQQEQIKLWRLVCIQQERIKMQDSQLELLDTELSSKEEEDNDLHKTLQKTELEIQRLQNLQSQYDRDMIELDNGRWIEAMDGERQAEKAIKNELTSFKSRLEKCEKDLKQFQEKVNLCSRELDKETMKMESDEKRRIEEEDKLRKQISELKRDLDNRATYLEKNSKTLETCEKDVEALEKSLGEKREQLSALEKDMMELNAQDFMEPVTVSDAKAHLQSGEDIYYYRLNRTNRKNLSSRSWRVDFRPV